MRNWFHILSCLFIACLLSCSGPRLVVQHDYLNRESLASYYVNTPDPRLDTPPIGQRLIVNWTVPKCYLDYQDLKLQLKLRFRNRQEEELSVALLSHRGTYTYELLDERYCETRGILTYKIDLMADGYILDEWRHQLWADLITFEDPED